VNTNDPADAGSTGSQTPEPETGARAERATMLATVGGVAAIVLVVVLANIVGAVGPDKEPSGGPPAATGTPSASPTPKREVLDALPPEQVAALGIKDRPPVGAKALAKAAEKAAAVQPYTFKISSFNVLGTQHTAPGGDAQDYAPGRIRADWAADLVAAYGASVVGMQEVQIDQLDAISRATGGRFAFYPGSELGAKGVPQSLMWDTTVWTLTYKTSITIPFVDTQRPQPIVRLQNIATGREIYVMNVHNSPKDAHGREWERDRAMAIEVAAIKELRKDNLPVFVTGDFNEHAEAFCKITGGTDLEAANGGSNAGGSCRPPNPMRVDWMFGSPDAAFSGFLMDTGAQVRRITDHAVLSATVTVS
jgi:endonuclease/exonuclease/phosphatase family metal-dependent hydrolase